jgi:hypothetical protein
MELQIKDEFKKYIPPLTVEEFKQLEDNCIAEGIRDAIVTWQGFIIDGHNRYEIAQKHGLKFRIEEKEFEGENEVREWMILNQFGRRNLSNYQRSVLALELEWVFRERAKEQQVRKPESVKQISAEQNPIETRKELAKVASVSHDTIAKVKKIEEVATPEVKAQLSTGEISINQAYQDIKKEEKKADLANKKDQYAERVESKTNNEFKVDIFNTDEELISKIRTYSPDIMVKGSDYINKPIIGEQYCKKIIFYDRITEYSTTQKIQDIIDRR